MNDNKRGGSRIGAGRPVLNPDARRKTRSITMDEARWLKFKALGGVKWLNKIIDSAKNE